jgi:predicted DNA-binding transcriptional regulator AlpA
VISQFGLRHSHPMKNETVFAQLPAVGYVRLRQILAVIPIGRSTWWKGVKEGRFPQPIKFSERVTVWSARDIWALIQTPTPPSIDGPDSERNQAKHTQRKALVRRSR